MLRLSFIFIAYLIYISCLDFSIAIASDTLLPSQFLSVNHTLVSSGKTFELGFFPRDNSSSFNKYLGIWYKNFSDIVVWVANREKPLQGNSNGGLKIAENGNLLLLDSNNITIWSSDSPKSQIPVLAKLLENGNFVVRDESASEGVFTWQSFDSPSDTLLEGMKMGWDFRTRSNRFLTSWRNSTDPSLGRFTYRIDYQDFLPQLVLREGSVKKFRTGPWNGVRFSGFHTAKNLTITPIFVFNSSELYYKYQINDRSVATIFRIDELGSLQRLVLVEGSDDWSAMYTVINNKCDNYGHCGNNGVCKIEKLPECECLKGFVPKSPKQWEILDWRDGCVRKIPFGCKEKVGFARIEDVKVPDVLDFELRKDLSLGECEEVCTKNCSCVAFANLDSFSGCLMWFGDLLDIREFVDENSTQYIYVKMLKIDLLLESVGNSGPSKRIVLIIAVSVVSVSLFCLGFCFMFWRKRRKRNDIIITGLRESEEELELPFFDFVTILNATDNFSLRNKLGEGGFGQVYKGNLLMQEVAVKRLSNNSLQGLNEFKNEATMIAKLQHRNLVKLIGYCIEGEERILIYEFMPNKSLDGLIFDDKRKTELNWQKRFEIIMGIARGLLYLHHDSRVRIIHRDLKTSNILLDEELNPKISDFGIARIFGGNQIEAKTKRVIGTYGYMSPEYAIDGKFSTKSDVFSFGVLLLEIVSGEKNRGFQHRDHSHTLLGHAWMLWNENKALDLIDQCLKDSLFDESEVLRCVQVGLLCVQKLPSDRPNMSSMILMLGTVGPTLPRPKQPGFFIERSSTDGDISVDVKLNDCTRNHVTVTEIEAR